MKEKFYVQTGPVIKIYGGFYSIGNPYWINLKVKKNCQRKKALTLAKETHWAPPPAGLLCA